MNIFMGAICGIIVGILICVVFSKKSGNTNGKIVTEYDERQKVIRGTSYKIGFYTYVISAAIMTCVSMAEISLPMQGDVLWFTWLIVGAIPMCVHSVWKGAYWGLNNDKARYITLFCLATAINVIVSVVAFVRGTMVVDGKLSTPFINFLCAMIFVVIGGTIIIKGIVDKKAEGED